MTRLCFRVEGQSEQAFVRNVLAPHFAQYNVIVTEVLPTALTRKRGRVHRGGLRSYEPLKNDCLRMLKADQNLDVSFTTMIDLYGLPRTFPGYQEAVTKNDAYERVALLERAFEKDIGDPRFIAYIQLYEFEALLFSQPEAVGRYFEQPKRLTASLVGLRDEIGNPELIDDGEDSAPSRRIGKAIPDYSRAKATAGPIIARAIGIPTMRRECAHFNQWLTKLENLGN